MGRSALKDFGLKAARLTPLRHEHNTTFRVDADGGPYVLRINRPGVHTPATIGSEMAWLAALRQDTKLGVPEPIVAGDGSAVVVASEPGVPEPRVCVLLRWVGGRFVDDRLSPRHLRAVGALHAGLQRHAASWVPPVGFARPRVDTLTDAAKRDSIVGSAVSARVGEHPTRDDANQALQLVADLVSTADAAVFAAALERVWATTRELGAHDGTTGLIHGDLHYENFLFEHGTPRVIDFDDCGWGFYLYDLVVSLWELESRPRYDEMRAALLDEYSRLRPLPVRHEAHLSAFAILRRMQMLTWVLESREHAAFRDQWQVWAREELDGISAALDAQR